MKYVEFFEHCGGKEDTDKKVDKVWSIWVESSLFLFKKREGKFVKSKRICSDNIQRELFTHAFTEFNSLRAYKFLT